MAVHTTVGGDGRAPIAVVNNAPAAGGEEKSEQTSSAILGNAEPGHDIFGAAPVKDIKSDGIIFADPEPVRVEEEEREISSVAGGSLTTETPPKPAAVEGPGQGQGAAEAKKAKDAAEVTSVASMDNTGMDPVSASGTDKETAEAAPTKPAGPLGEAEVEAAKAAEDLFPEAA